MHKMLHTRTLRGIYYYPSMPIISSLIYATRTTSEIITEENNSNKRNGGFSPLSFAFGLLVGTSVGRHSGKQEERRTHRCK